MPIQSIAIFPESAPFLVTISLLSVRVFFRRSFLRSSISKSNQDRAALDYLHAGFKSKQGDFRDSWQGNAFKVPPEFVNLLPPSVIIKRYEGQ